MTHARYEKNFDPEKRKSQTKMKICFAMSFPTFSLRNNIKLETIIKTADFNYHK